MWKFLRKRLLITIPILIGLTLAIYVMASLMPGSPLDSYLADPEMTTEMLEFKRQQLGLDKPVLVQFFTWFGQVLKGDLGFSYRTGQPVWDIISQRIGPTLLLSLTATVLSILISVPLGVMAAYKPYSGWDYISSGFSFLGASMPNFFLAMVLIYIFSIQLRLTPMNGMYTSLIRKTDLIPHLILPTLTLAFQQVGSYLRLIRSSMLETLDDDYIRTARSKGLSEPKVVILHGLRNVLIPLVARLGLNIPSIVGGAVVTEQIFSWPGLGALMVLSINAKDYPTIMGTALIIYSIVLSEPFRRILDHVWRTTGSIVLLLRTRVFAARNKALAYNVHGFMIVFFCQIESLQNY